MVDPVATYEALCAIRAADDPVARELGRAWATVDDALRHYASRTPMGGIADREDARQEAFLRTYHGVREMKAESPAAAMAWLRSIYQNLLFDQLRKQQRRREQLDHGAQGGERPILDTLPSPPAIDPRIHDPSALEPLEAALFDAVEHFTGSMRPLHRGKALRNAQLAYRWCVKGEPMEALHAELAEASRDALYQWLRRGRALVLVPAIEQWLRTLTAESAEHEFAVSLLGLLRGADRSDAGKPRPDRRKNDDDAAVSSEDHCKSAQCDPHEGDE